MMDTRTGKIYSGEEIKKKLGEGSVTEAEFKKYFIGVEPTAQQLKRSKIGRNDPCPCGSGKKFKRCHYQKVTS